MFRRNIFPRRPLANSGIGKHTTGTSTSEAEALLSRRAGCHAVVAWVRPGACRLTRAVLRAASTRRCMREAGAAPPAALSPEPGPPKRGSAPTAPRPPWGFAGAGGRGGGIAEPQPSQPGAGGRAASASRPVRSSAPSASRSPTLPRSLWPSHTSTALASGRSLLGEERAVQRRLRDPWPLAARPTHPRHPRGVRAHPASSAGTPRASEPRGWRGPPGGRFRPSGSRDGGGVCPHTPSPTSGPAVSPDAPSGQAVPLRPPLPSRAGFAPAVAEGKFALPAACGAPPALHRPSRAMQFAAPERRGEGCAPGRGRPFSHPRPHLLTQLPGRRAVGEGASSSSSSACSRPAGRRGRPVRRHRPMLPARTCPVLPGRADPPPRAPAAALRLRSAPRPRPRAAPLQIPPAPPVHSRTRSHLS